MKRSSASIRSSGRLYYFRGRPAWISIRKRDEFHFVSWHLREPAFLPVPLGLLDALARARHEVPVDVPGAVEGRAPEEDDASRRIGAEDHARTGDEDEHSAGLGPLGAAPNSALDYVEGPLLVLIRDGERAAGGHPGFDVEERRQRLHRRSHAERRARENPEAYTFLIALGQARTRMMMERGFSLFVSQRQRDPQLKTVQPRALLASIGVGALRMDDAAPGRHPVDVAGPNRLLRAEAVPVNDLTLEGVRHRRQANMRMRRHVEPLTHREPTIHLVEEGVGADHAARRRWKDATDGDPAEVARTRIDHARDHGYRARARTERLDRRSDAHAPKTMASVHLFCWGPAVDLNPRRSIS